MARGRGVIALALTFVLGILSTGVASAAPGGNNGRGNGVSAEQVHGALKGVPGVLDGARGANPKANARAKGQSIVHEISGEVVADVPLDPRKGVRLGKGANALTINLPEVATANKGVAISDGAVAYASSGDAANAVNITEQGAQLLTVINSSSAPTQYSYDLNLPAGYTINVSSEMGGVVVLDANNQGVAFFSAPWAQDANGVPVPTRFSAEGEVLTQYVDHATSNVAYPVVADPYFRWYWDGVVITLTPDDMLAVAYGGTQTLAWMLSVPGWGWASYAGVLWAAGSALWAYHNGYCFWFWVSPFWWSSEAFGTYRCR